MDSLDLMKNEKTIYLIDGSAYIYRAYHAIRGLSNSKGQPTNAVFGFTRMLLSLIEQKNPAYLCMFFDAKGPTFRHKMYADYKANRPPMPEDLLVQLPQIREITDGFNIKIIEKQGFEADDLIGTCARLAEKAGFKTIMITGDKDFIQLITPSSLIWDPMKNKEIDLGAVLKEFELEPEKMIDVMGLSGDKADNVPGVPGIGPKTAQVLIKKFGSLEQLYQQVDTITKKKQHENLVNFKDQAFLSKDLVTIDTNVQIEFDPANYYTIAPDYDKLANLFGRLEFNQLKKILPRKSDLSKKDYRPVQKIDDLISLVKDLKNSGLFAIDTETTSKNPMLARLVGISVAMQKNQAFYIPCGHESMDKTGQLAWPEILTHLKPLLEDPEIKKIGQNIKYDWLVLERHGINLKGVAFDTMLASYLINPSRRSHSLDQIALEYLDHQTITYQDVTGKGKTSISFAKVPLTQAVPYACEDADITFLASSILAEKMAVTGLTDLFEKVEMPLVPVLLNMEKTGICVDQTKLKNLSKEFGQKLDQLSEDIFSKAGKKFNLNSPKQLGKILFEELKLPVKKKTKKKTGFSTDVNVLTELAKNYELPGLVLRHRSLSKLKSTYTDALLELINPETNRIHTSYNQTVTATGRLSSSEPNLQNIPIRSKEGRKIREAFIPRPGWHFVAADYSQIELRILAHYADDPILIKAFDEDEDIHTRTATEVFQVFPSFITPELRRHAKIINFGIIYGMSPYRLSRELGISSKMAKSYIHNYFTRYKGVKKFIDDAVSKASKTGKTSTLLGRVRFLPDINSPNRNMKAYAQRTAVNTPIQGTAADLIKIAMINMEAALRGKNLKSVMLLTVHDEIVFETPPEELETVKNLAKTIMEGVWQLKVPLKVNIASGHNWAIAH